MRSSLLLLLAAAMVAALAVRLRTALRDDGPARASGEDVGAPVDPPVVLIRSGDPVQAAWADGPPSVPGVDEAIYVRRGQTLLRRVTRTSGEVVQEVRRGYAIPVDTLVAEPRAYASMLPGRRPSGRGAAAPG